MPDVFARAHRPHRTDHACIWGSASGLASGCGGGLCALDLWLLPNSGRAHVPVRDTGVGMYGDVRPTGVLEEPKIKGT